MAASPHACGRLRPVRPSVATSGRSRSRSLSTPLLRLIRSDDPVTVRRRGGPSSHGKLLSYPRLLSPPDTGHLPQSRPLAVHGIIIQYSVYPLETRVCCRVSDQSAHGWCSAETRSSRKRRWSIEHEPRLPKGQKIYMSIIIVLSGSSGPGEALLLNFSRCRSTERSLEQPETAATGQCGTHTYADSASALLDCYSSSDPSV